jgi:cobalt-zinc-cadmium resistance protein CzcA
VSQVGRPDDGTDVTGFYNIEIFAPLRPPDQWRDGLNKDRLIEEIHAELHRAFPGAQLNFSQMISDNVEEAVAGVKGENSIKVFGPDLDANEATAESIMRTVSRIRGVTDLGMFRTLGQPDIRIVPDRVACARFGLNTGDVGDVIEAAIGGRAVTQVYEGERRFDLTVRWLPEDRQSMDAIRRVLVNTPDGETVPLAQIATVSIVNGPVTIYREDGERYAPVKFSVRGRDLAGTVNEARASIQREVHMPYGTRLSWSGEINELHDAIAKLEIVVPVTLALILLLTWSAVRSWLDTAIVSLSIPVAVAGGALALLITRTHFSVSAAMGFVSILGLAVQDAILVVTYFQRLRSAGSHDARRAAREAAEKRLRAALMTTLVATLGLMPAAVSNGIGAQAQKPLAIVVIGGSLMLAIVSRVVQPPVLYLAHAWLDRRRARGAGAD